MSNVAERSLASEDLRPCDGACRYLGHIVSEDGAQVAFFHECAVHGQGLPPLIVRSVRSLESLPQLDQAP
jgi:hypothetical protein